MNSTAEIAAAFLTTEAASHFHRALQLAELKSEQAFLARRLHECEGHLQSQSAPMRGYV